MSQRLPFFELFEFWKLPLEFKEDYEYISLDALLNWQFPVQHILILRYFEQKTQNLETKKKYSQKPKFSRIELKLNSFCENELNSHQFQFPKLEIIIDESNFELLRQLKVQFESKNNINQIITIKNQDECLPLVISYDNHLIFLLSFDDLIHNLLIEQHKPIRAPFFLQLPFPYQIIPSQIRNWWSNYQLKKNLNKKSLILWPLDLSVDLIRILFLICIKFQKKIKIPYLSFWPSGKEYALIITHDVDSSKGFQLSEKFLSFEGLNKISASYFAITKFQQFSAFRKKIEDQSSLFELGSHGWSHSGKIAFQTTEKTIKELDRIQSKFSFSNSYGFRSPMLYRNCSLFNLLSTRIAYDSSVPTSDLNVQGIFGCCSVFPYNMNSLLELPLSLPMDYVFLSLGWDFDKISQYLNRVIEQIKSIHGMIMFNLHPESKLSGDSENFKFFTTFIANFIEKNPHIFNANCKNIAHWWNLRKKSDIFVENGKYRVKLNSESIELQPQILYF